MQEVVVVYEAHEDTAEADRGELVSHSCSEEVLGHGKNKNNAQSHRARLDS